MRIRSLMIAAVIAFPFSAANATDHGGRGGDPSARAYSGAYAGASAGASATGYGGAGGNGYAQSGTNINGGIGNTSIPNPLMVLGTGSAPGLSSGHCQGSFSLGVWLVSGGKTTYDAQVCAIELANYARAIGRPDIADRIICTNDQWRSVNEAECKFLLDEGKRQPAAAVVPEPPKVAFMPLPLCTEVKNPNLACRQGY